MIALSRALRHLQWADDRFFAALAALPDSAMAARYSPDAWSAGQLAVHIVEGAEWYRFCLTGTPWAGPHSAATTADRQALRNYLGELDDVLMAEAVRPDDEVSFQDEDGPRSALRSTILSQACLHAAEHRAQIACAVEAAGAGRIDLDALDLWAFESWERSSGGGVTP